MAQRERLRETLLMLVCIPLMASILDKGVPYRRYIADGIFNEVLYDFLRCIRHAPVTGVVMPPRPSSLALIATMTVLAVMNTAPTAGVSRIPQ